MLCGGINNHFFVPKCVMEAFYRGTWVKCQKTKGAPVHVYRKPKEMSANANSTSHLRQPGRCTFKIAEDVLDPTEYSKWDTSRLSLIHI